MEEIPAGDIHTDGGRLYCNQCGSELEVGEDSDLFEQIVGNRSGFLFRDREDDEDLGPLSEEEDEGLTTREAPEEEQ